MYFLGAFILEDDNKCLLDIKDFLVKCFWRYRWYPEQNDLAEQPGSQSPDKLVYPGRIQMGGRAYSQHHSPSLHPL